jgi:hypothetical protein
MASDERFKPHYNSAFGKMIHTKKEYLSEMKRTGSEPYRGEGRKTSSAKPYIPSEWAHKMVNSVNHDRKGKPIVGERFINELKKHGMKEVPRELRGKTTGGMYSS